MSIVTSEKVSRRAGFTLLEIVFSAAILTVVMSIMMSAYLFALGEVGGDSLHIRYIDIARAAEQRFVNVIQAQPAVGVSSNGLEVFNQDYQLEFTIRYEDADGDVATIDDNAILIDPDLSVANDESVLCSQVSPLGTETMFRMAPSVVGTAQLTCHIGETAPAAGMAQRGRNYHGVEVRIAATPRNSNVFMQ